MTSNPIPLKCFVKTPLDAALLINSPDIIQPCSQRLDALQRESISSGSCFVFTEDSGLKRWTDGFQWSKSRIDNHFLVYQEVRAKGLSSGESSTLPSPVEEEFEKSREIALKLTNIINKKKLTIAVEGGMRKRTFAISVDEVVNHVVCYYKDGHSLQAPSEIDLFKSRIDSLPPKLLDTANFRLRGKSPRSISVPVIVDPSEPSPIPNELPNATESTTIGALAPVKTNFSTPLKHLTVQNIQNSNSFTLLMPPKFVEFKKQVRHQFDLVQDDLQVYTTDKLSKISNQQDYASLADKSTLMVGFRKDFMKRKCEDDHSPNGSPRFSAALGLLGLNGALVNGQPKVGFYSFCRGQGGRSEIEPNKMVNKCIHDKQLRFCADCDGRGLCKLHGKRKYQCRECGGSAFCIHDKQKSKCRDCGGSAFCIHGKRKSRCRDCGGSATCSHSANKYKCKKCYSTCERHNVQRCFDCLPLDTNTRKNRAKLDK